MTATTEIGTASLADIPDLCDLLTLLFAQEREFQPDRTAQQRGLAAIIADPALGCILAARSGGKVVGMVNLLYTVSTALGGRVALLEDMAVAPDYRGLGIGSRLLAHAIETARTNHCLRITLLTDRDNLAAQRFYRRQGFELSTMAPMRLRLDA